MGRALFHLIFGLMTGGIWWIWLAIRYVTK